MRVPVQKQYMAELPPENARSSYMAVSSMSYNISMLVCSITITVIVCSYQESGRRFLSGDWTYNKM